MARYALRNQQKISDTFGKDYTEMDEVIEIPEDYPYTECEVCGEEIHNSHLHDVGNRYVCACCAEFLEAQEDYDDDYDDDYDYDYDDYLDIND